MALAARVGDVLVLDGIHRLPPGALVAALGRLAEGALELPQERLLVAKGFRLLALAEPGEWLSPEIAALFVTHVLPEMTPLELSFALPVLVPSATTELCQQVTAVATAAVVTQSDPNGAQGEKAALRLSLRVLLRLARQAAASGGDLRELLHESLMSRFLPKRLRETIDGWLDVAGIHRQASNLAPRRERVCHFWLLGRSPRRRGRGGQHPKWRLSCVASESRATGAGASPQRLLCYAGGPEPQRHKGFLAHKS